LSRSFEEMTAGLRERADMQKFVSQSTVEMIHSHHAERQAGERRTLTLLFSDIRGFTNFADGRLPEDAVRVLNRHLRLQANLENLTDRRYYVNADSNTNISPGFPRTLRVGLTASF